jgi:hypothetical protein
MNLSQRQKIVSNHVLYSTLLLKDLCHIVAQYVFAGAFQMNVKKTMKVEDDECFKLPVAVCTQVNVTNGQIFTANWMNGKQYVCIRASVYCEGKFFIDLGSYSKWIGCNEALKEAYFISEKGFILTINEKGEDPIARCWLPSQISKYLFNDPQNNCVVTQDRKVVFWGSITRREHEERVMSLNLVLGVIESDGGTIPHIRIMNPASSIRPQWKLFIFSGDSEDEIWSFNVAGIARIYSLSSLQFLRSQCTHIHTFNILSFQQKLYLFKKQGPSVEISIFE